MPIEKLSVRVQKYTYNEEEGRLEVSGLPFEMGTQVNLGSPRKVMHKKRLVAVIPVVRGNGQETGLLIREDEKETSEYDQRQTRTKSHGRSFVPSSV